MSTEFANKVAIVTGGASGIGEAVVRELAAGGAKVVIADFNLEGAQALADEVGSATAFKVDVGDPEQVEAMVKFAVDTYGGLHLAVNNAGIGGPSAPTADYPIDAWKRVIDVDLHSVLYSMKYEIPAMLACGGGSIVNMASILGSHGWAGSGPYVAAKHALVGMTKTTAIEYSGQGVRINAVGPGFIDTPAVRASMDEAAMAGLVGLHPIGRLGRSEEVSALTCFLLSDRASFITGSYHLVDGGFSAR
ncbi:short-chain dehydrogenase [Caulobacter sp. D4A]|uniref:SDR family NAD(P)-dependent oxidoreductase n=1 Tax=unclassified Caulobacter TaxID=2648921 RepID=UPI000D7317E1|nr:MULTISPECIES: SDR family NAD(P)-dependent oxidoreductase [unclassified Caulobacter]PXA92194.1 short-chain dehydrogenase [Caulobacter sp. D5]PXA93589.1 short-chain dehydrogenase [Caulobacter sp. D4A]